MVLTSFTVKVIIDKIRYFLDIHFRVLFDIEMNAMTSSKILSHVKDKPFRAFKTRTVNIHRKQHS